MYVSGHLEHFYSVAQHPRGWGKIKKRGKKFNCKRIFFLYEIKNQKFHTRYELIDKNAILSGTFSIPGKK